MERHRAGFQIVLTGVGSARRRKFGHVPGHAVPNQLVGRTSGFDEQLANLGRTPGPHAAKGSNQD
jgi:hypothetical protein